MTAKEIFDTISDRFWLLGNFDEKYEHWVNKYNENLYLFIPLIEQATADKTIIFIQSEIKQNLKFQLNKHAVKITYTTKEELLFLVESV